MLQDPHILNVSTRALLHVCRQDALDVDGALLHTHTDRRALEAPSGRVRASSAHALWTWAHERSSLEDLSLRVAQVAAFGSYQLVDFLVSSASKLEMALRALAQALPTINPAIVASVYETHGLLHFQVEGLEHLSYAEFVLSVCYLHTTAAFCQKIPLQRVEMAFPIPCSIEPHERLFGCPVHYDAPHTRMSIRAELGGARHAHSNASLHAHLHAHMVDVLARMHATSTASDLLREILADGLHTGDVCLDGASRRMGVSPRTLQRQLRLEHRTFRSILDNVREEHAYVLISDPNRSLAEISHQLGFSEQSAFQRAFRRWTGMTPRAWRA